MHHVHHVHLVRYGCHTCITSFRFDCIANTVSPENRHGSNRLTQSLPGVEVMSLIQANNG